MPARLEVTLKPELFDAEGAAICRKANDYFGFNIKSVRTVNILTIDTDLTKEQLEAIQKEIFTNPVTEISSYKPLDIDFDWLLWVGYRPGVRDNPGSTAEEIQSRSSFSRRQPQQLLSGTHRAQNRDHRNWSPRRLRTVRRPSWFVNRSLFR